jgi:hypothetical protein
METMQRYRLRIVPCDTADMTRNTISPLFPNRMGSQFEPFHSLLCLSIRLIRLIRLFFHQPLVSSCQLPLFSPLQSSVRNLLSLNFLSATAIEHRYIERSRRGARDGYLQ